MSLVTEKLSTSDLDFFVPSTRESTFPTADIGPGFPPPPKQAQKSVQVEVESKSGPGDWTQGLTHASSTTGLHPQPSTG
jgi:hypothetical protein